MLCLVVLAAVCRAMQQPFLQSRTGMTILRSAETCKATAPMSAQVPGHPTCCSPASVSPWQCLAITLAVEHVMLVGVSEAAVCWASLHQLVSALVCLIDVSLGPSNMP